MTNLESILNSIRSPSFCGVVFAFAGSIGIFFYSIYSSNIFFKEKETGDNFVTINLAAFAPPSKDPISDQIRKPKHKPRHKHKPKHDEIVAPPKPEPSPLVAKEEVKPEEKTEATNDMKPVEKTDATESEVATTIQTSPDAEADQNIKVMRFSDGEDNEFLKAIRAAIERKHRYPTLALKRGYEGIVLVKFLITDSGQVSRVHVTKACPHDSLNREAMSTIKKAARLFPKPIETTYIEIPIVYAIKTAR